MSFVKHECLCGSGSGYCETRGEIIHTIQKDCALTTVLFYTYDSGGVNPAYTTVEKGAHCFVL